MAIRWRWPPDSRAPAFAEETVVAAGKLGDEFVGVGGLGGGEDLLLARVPFAVAKVVAGRGGEDHRVLGNQGDARADRGGIGVAKVDAVEQ